MGALAAGLLVLVAGCGGGASDPCAGKSGVCLTVEVHGDVGTFDALQVSATPPDGTTLIGFTSGNDAPITLPVQLAALLPDGTQGKIQVHVSALRSGVPIGGGGAPVTVPPSGQRVIVDLIPIPTDDGGISDLSLADLSQSDAPPPDQLMPQDLAVRADLFGVTPPVFDSVGMGSINGSSITWIHTIKSVDPNTILLVAIANRGGFVIADNAVTDNGKVMSRLDEMLSIDNAKLQDIVFYALDPGSGQHNLVLLMQGGGSDDLSAYSVAFSHVRQVAPVVTEAMGATSTVNMPVACSPVDVVVDFLAAEGNAMNGAPGASQTGRYQLSTGTGMTNVLQDVSTGSGADGIVQMSWALGGPAPWLDIGVDLAPP